ncbi:alanine--tRNA ligase, mitochondrial isoform X1 [Esox lucius]|uniref:alanine--tRNA ligase, mitochondrial isoform X1 n=1 Tax=Esox lucius TaxID=8010 RepID=UPI00147743C6|nr:alanine--tRNA ligase, mitochondrial isoform X1 [Esox lucius]
MAARIRFFKHRCNALINMNSTSVIALRECLSRSYHVQKDFSSKQVRKTFTDFFHELYQHRIVKSSPVRPRGDTSLLFVNAGMNQFKPIFLGAADPRSEMVTYRRVVNSQKCVRAGGKHNDLEDVGRDVYHHTFFEMLGNWSFGDYFKEEACGMAWRLLTEEYRIPPERLYVSYFAGDAISGLPADEETRHIWLSIGVPADHLLPFGMRDNFWEMGETGPCGPCTEIHYDHIGGRNAALLVNADSPDVVEIWNLVFMQYNREADHSLRSLPHFSVDTGMGLERLVSVLQGQRSNYDTDLFTPLLSAIQQCANCPKYRGRTGEADVGKVDMAYRVVADHVRTLSVCIADGVYPGMSGAELVLRRILRRAVRFSSEVLQAPEGSLAGLVPTVAHILGDTYPELHKETDRIMDVINENEAQFLSSLKQGRRVIDRTLQRLEGSNSVFPAPVAWSLHRNLGFPLDLIGLMLEEKGMCIDQQSIDELASANEKLKRQTQSSGRETLFHLDLHTLAQLQADKVPQTDDFLKYHYSLGPDDKYVFQPCHATVQALYCGQALVSEVAEGQRCGVVLDRTCFYAEQGGQSHDQGYFIKDGLQDVMYPVEAVHLAGGYVVHQVTTADVLTKGDQVQLYVDEAQRLACMVKHTATHILNFALRQHLGPSVEQRGSHVAADRLRFDFSVKGSLSTTQLQEIEKSIRNIITEDSAVYIEEVSLARVKDIPGLRTVEEVYPDPVRVVSVAVPISDLFVSQTVRPTSVELCCGTHLRRTGEIGDLVIVSERQMVKGISRIIAVTGDDARQAQEAGQALAQEVESLMARLAAVTSPCLASTYRLAKEVGVLTDAVDCTPIPQWQRRELQTHLKSLQRTTNTIIRKLETKEAAVKAQSLKQKNGNKTVVVDTVDTDSISVLMKTVNQYSGKAPGSVVMLLSHQRHSGKVLCACQVPKGLSALSANDWALAVCAYLGGNAGGSSTVAKGTGNVADLAVAIRYAETFAKDKIQHQC